MTRTPELQFEGGWAGGNRAESAHKGALCSFSVLSALGEGSTPQKMPNLPLHSRLGDGECGVRNIFLLLLFCKWTELAGWGFGQCSWSTERGEKQVIKKAAVLCLSSLCVLWAKMTSNYCSAIWTVIKLGGFQIPGTCECPYLPEECPWPWGAERSSPGPDAEITAEIPVPAWVFENVGENLAFNELQGRFTNPSRAGTCTYIYFCCSEFLPITWPLMPAA